MESNSNQQPENEQEDKMLDIEDGPEKPEQISSKKIDIGLGKEVINKIEEKKGETDPAKAEKAKIQMEKLMQVMKALTAMKLTKEDPVPGKVFEDIYIGSIGCAYNSKKMKELGITHILCCAANIKPRFPKEFVYCCLNALDSPSQGIIQFTDQANHFITEALSQNTEGQPPVNKVLVHCFAGKSRATSFLLGYMMKIRNIRLATGLEMIRAVRPIVAPNPGFMIQLKALERSLFGDISECEVMQGKWAEQLEQMKKVKEEKAAAGEDTKPLEMPDEEAQIANVEKQLMAGGEIKMEGQGYINLRAEELQMQSEMKQIKDAEEQLAKIKGGKAQPQQEQQK